MKPIQPTDGPCSSLTDNTSDCAEQIQSEVDIAYNDDGEPGIYIKVLLCRIYMYTHAIRFNVIHPTGFVHVYVQLVV